ncbi:MAG: TfoX/Sxy family protein [bacterium]|nr:TfoX/Sxy family protein [bacterium]
MASSKGYLQFVLEQLSELSDITYRAMMGEYIIYYRGKIIGGIYDDRFLVKPVKSAIALMEETVFELPYEGAKEMLLVEDIDNKEFLTKLIETMYEELPTPKRRK